MLSKQHLIDAHEQGLIINTKAGTKLKIIANLMDIFAIQYCNSTKIEWFSIEKFNELQCTIEQPKPKIDLSILKEGEIYFIKSDKNSYLIKFIKHQLTNIEIIWDCNFALRNNCIYREVNGIKASYITELRLPTESELELFYSKFPELKPKKYIQGFEVKDGYNEIVSCSNDNVNFRIDILKIVYSDNCEFPFTCVNGSYRYARYPRKEEINEINFID